MILVVLYNTVLSMWRICIPSKALTLYSLKAWLIWEMPSPTVILRIQ